MGFLQLLVSKDQHKVIKHWEVQRPLNDFSMSLLETQQTLLPIHVKHYVWQKICFARHFIVEFWPVLCPLISLNTMVKVYGCEVSNLVCCCQLRNPFPIQFNIAHSYECILWTADLWKPSICNTLFTFTGTLFNTERGKDMNKEGDLKVFFSQTHMPSINHLYFCLSKKMLLRLWGLRVSTVLECWAWFHSNPWSPLSLPTITINLSMGGHTCRCVSECEFASGSCAASWSSPALAGQRPGTDSQKFHGDISEAVREQSVWLIALIKSKKNKQQQHIIGVPDYAMKQRWDNPW